MVVVPGFLIFHWMINRIYIQEGQSLQLRYKGPLVFGKENLAKNGYWAEEGEVGILKELQVDRDVTSLSCLVERTT
ncbi:MAG: hypothetical protein R3C11_28430 [Planctomycetaceae bacterium]